MSPSLLSVLQPHLIFIQVDNVILRDPPMLRNPLFAGLNLLPLPAPQQQPCPGAWFKPAALQVRSLRCILLSDISSGSRCTLIPTCVFRFIAWRE